MQKRSVNKRAMSVLRTQGSRRTAVRLVTLLSVCSLAFVINGLNARAAQMSAANFDTVFSALGEPASLHYEVTFGGEKAPHTLAVWRDGQTRLRRKTDGALDTYVVRDVKDPTEYRMTVVDYERRITTQIDRTNLIKLGQFSEWFDLSHGLRHPIGAYRLQASRAPDAASMSAPVAACKWYALSQDADSEHRICWSSKDRLPLVIWSSQKGVVWRVTKVTPGPIADALFALNDAGFVRNNANADISDD
jgi:hypothetical protein